MKPPHTTAPLETACSVPPPLPRCVRSCLLAISIWGAGAGPMIAAGRGPELPGRPPVPVIHCTDLFHPHDDPDDHFDLAVMYALPGIDLKAVILDQGRLQLTRPGTVPVAQLNHLTGRNVPAAIGLAERLRAPTDPARDEPPRFQQGVELISSTLRQSPSPVAITIVGSARDVVAAFNREPGLFRRKVDKLLVFLGEASDPTVVEWNVTLDPQAYLGLMRSGLPIYWVPCFDGGFWQNHGHASFWQARHADLFRHAPPPVLQFFLYAFDHEQSDPLAWLRQPVDADRRQRWLEGTRNLWCAAVLEFLVAPEHTAPVFGFSPVRICVGDDGVLRYGKSREAKRVMRFEIRDREGYAAKMTAATARLLARLGQTRQPVPAAP